MAEGILKKILNDVNKTNIKVSSAGINAIDGSHANEKAIKVMKDNGIDISLHRATQLSDDIIMESDLILTMTYAQKMTIQGYDPKSKNKIFTLKEFVCKITEQEIDRNNLDIDDPYGMDYNVYNQSMRGIEKELNKLLNNYLNGGKNENSSCV